MSWIQKLHETYERCYDAPQFSNHPLLPISHAIQQAHIEVTLDHKGNFRRAKIVQKVETILPATEKSAARTSGEAPHPLCDKVQYCASDYPKHGGKKKSYYPGYAKQLTSWSESSFSHPKARAVLEYVRKGSVVADLVREKVLHVGDDKFLLTAWKSDLSTPDIFKYLTAKEGERDQGDALIRWRVEMPADPIPETWEDKSLREAWIAFDAYQSQHQDDDTASRNTVSRLKRGKDHKPQQGLCMVTGKTMLLATNHPKRLRHGGDGAKLISSNDTDGYTFRGRFLGADEACSVGFEVTQKAHSALRWLIARQAFRSGDQAVVAWAVSGKSLPDPFANSAQMFGLELEEEDAAPVYQGDAGQAFAVRLKRYIAGYRARLGSTDEIVVMALDSATPGRMAIIYYRELTGSEFLERIQLWHESYAWHQNFGKDLKFVGVPSPRDIATAAYGRQVEGKSGEKLRKATVERLLPCIIDGRPIPRDLVESTVRRTANRPGLEKWEWEKNLGIACALFRGDHKEGNYKMALELDRTSRDYLFGRLLAVADRIEGLALHLADEKRDTNAAKLMQRFADHPYSTWRTIELSLAPYKARLRARSPGFLVNMEKLIDGIVCAFNGQDFMSETRLSGEFLLGYHCQRQALWPKSESTQAAEITENQTNQGA
ncbi:MAG: type I-C CRISPR-associated protein Cas8c/Csd1 [Nitrospirae bacterium]|nr:type I-C CRISPR-associated protein Cas8c/Csd1 [Nitrospirota bacterium]